MRWFRQCDRRYPFFWESPDQPAARWHAAGDGPVQYLADTPDGAWAEFLRHEEITDSKDLDGVSRALWVVEDQDEAPTSARPGLPVRTMTGGTGTYPVCQDEARSLRDAGARSLVAPSAALHNSRSLGYRVERGFQAEPREAQILVLFGRRPNAVGWLVVDDGRPPAGLIARVRQL